MRSNSSDVIVVDATDYGSSGGGSAQLRPDQCCSGVIGAVARSSDDSRISTAVAWIWHRGVDRCGRGILARRDDDGGIGDDGSEVVWEASAGGDQTEIFDLLTA
jgi:hypothetical protein